MAGAWAWVTRESGQTHTRSVVRLNEAATQGVRGTNRAAARRLDLSAVRGMRGKEGGKRRNSWHSSTSGRVNFRPPGVAYCDHYRDVGGKGARRPIRPNGDDRRDHSQD